MTSQALPKLGIRIRVRRPRPRPPRWWLALLMLCVWLWLLLANLSTLLNGEGDPITAVFIVVAVAWIVHQWHLVTKTDGRWIVGDPTPTLAFLVAIFATIVGLLMYAIKLLVLVAGLF